MIYATNVIPSTLVVRFLNLPLVPTRSARRAEHSRSTPWHRPEPCTSRRRPAGSSVVQAEPEPSPWWYHPSEPPGWGKRVTRGDREGQNKRKERLIRKRTITPMSSTDSVCLVTIVLPYQLFIICSALYWLHWLSCSHCFIFLSVLFSV